MWLAIFDTGSTVTSADVVVTVNLQGGAPAPSATP